MRAAKFDPTSEKWVFVGYAQDADAYLLLNPDTMQVINERNLKVVDGVFPFCEKKEKGAVKCHCPETPEATVESARPVPDLFVIRDATVYSSGGESATEGRADVDQSEPSVDASEGESALEPCKQQNFTTQPNPTQRGKIFNPAQPNPDPKSTQINPEQPRVNFLYR